MKLVWSKVKPTLKEGEYCLTRGDGGIVLFWRSAECGMPSNLEYSGIFTVDEPRAELSLCPGCKISLTATTDGNARCTCCTSIYTFTNGEWVEV